MGFLRNLVSFAGKKSVSRPSAAQAVSAMASTLAEWDPLNVEHLQALSCRSLESVTHLTEHEDEKANRISTAMAFLSAFSSVLFAAYVQQFPLSRIEQMQAAKPVTMLAIGSYCVFGLYAFLLIIGVTIALWTVRPRFNVPSGWSGKGPKSFLFFEKIAETAPAQWVDAFVRHDCKHDLMAQYAKNNIFETYLIAVKIGWKVSLLRRAVLFYVPSIGFLGAWILIAAWSVCAAHSLNSAFSVKFRTPNQSATSTRDERKNATGPALPSSTGREQKRTPSTQPSTK